MQIQQLCEERDKLRGEVDGVASALAEKRMAEETARQASELREATIARQAARDKFANFVISWEEKISKGSWATATGAAVAAVLSGGMCFLGYRKLGLLGAAVSGAIVAEATGAVYSAANTGIRPLRERGVGDRRSLKYVGTSGLIRKHQYKFVDYDDGHDKDGRHDSLSQRELKHADALYAIVRYTQCDNDVLVLSMDMLVSFELFTQLCTPAVLNPHAEDGLAYERISRSAAAFQTVNIDRYRSLQIYGDTIRAPYQDTIELVYGAFLSMKQQRRHLPFHFAPNVD